MAELKVHHLTGHDRRPPILPSGAKLDLSNHAGQSLRWRSRGHRFLTLAASRHPELVSAGHEPDHRGSRVLIDPGVPGAVALSREEPGTDRDPPGLREAHPPSRHTAHRGGSPG